MLGLLRKLFRRKPDWRSLPRPTYYAEPSVILERWAVQPQELDFGYGEAQTWLWDCWALPGIVFYSLRVRNQFASREEAVTRLLEALDYAQRVHGWDVEDATGGLFPTPEAAAFPKG